MKYYSTQRPVMPGGYPKTQNVVRIENFDRREHIPNINRDAWGWIEYEQALADKEAADYELVPEVPEKERLKAILNNAVDMIVEHEFGDCSRYETKREFWLYLLGELGTDLVEMHDLGIDLIDLYDAEVR